MLTIVLGIACLSVQYFAKVVGYDAKKAPYDLVGLGGLFFLLTAASSLEFGGPDIIHHVVGLVGVIAPIMGWLSLLGGVLISVLDLLVHHEKLLPH